MSARSARRDRPTAAGIRGGRAGIGAVAAVAALAIATIGALLSGPGVSPLTLAVEFLLPYLSEVSAPLLGRVQNAKPQRNDAPEELTILPAAPSTEGP